MKRHETVLQQDQTLLLVVDYQEKLVPAMMDHDVMTADLNKLAQGMSLLHIPILVTEQYPKGLGYTLPDLMDALRGAVKVEKTTFSCCGDASFAAELEKRKVKQIVLAGIESHVCILQTGLDLLGHGYQVHIPLETNGSRALKHKENALRRLEAAGAILTNVESALFELMVDSKHPAFRDIQKVIK
ncbi:isochorismatase family protein [bacterium]|nr:isochorismatase family protein [bacterium]